MRVLFCVALLATWAGWGSLAIAQEGEPAPEAIKIPLETIWAYDMPRTRDVSGIDLLPFGERRQAGWGFEEFRKERQGAIDAFRKALVVKPPDELAAFGFAIPRRADILALKYASSRAGMKASPLPTPVAPRQSFQAGEEMTLAFFTYPSSYYIELHDVERRGTAITVRYRVVPHYTAESSVHFALIPLGKLPAGEYHVEYKQAPMERRFREDGFIRYVTTHEQRLVCRRFSFTIWDPPSEELATAEFGATLIPLKEIWALDMGAGDVRELEAGVDRRNSSTSQINRWLMDHNPRWNQNTWPITRPPSAGPGFAVRGMGAEALKEAAAKLGRPREGREAFAKGSDLTAVFFSHPTFGYVLLDSVERKENEITIKYRVVIHQTANVTTHFALIPLGKLPVGEYRVRPVQLPSRSEFPGAEVREVDPYVVARDVCGPFTIRVVEGF